MRKNDIVTADVDGMSNLGYGVARVGGKATFINGAADGDKAEIRIIKTAQSYNAARLEKLIEPSPHRCDPSCPAFPRCGGCSFRHITYEHEKELKRGFVESAMKKNHIDIEVAEVVSDGNISGWRNKVEYPVGGGGFGCYARHTHTVVNLPDGGCAIQDRAFDPIVSYISGVLDRIRGLRHIYLRRAAGTGEIMVCFVTLSSAVIPGSVVHDLTGRFPDVVSVARNINDSDGNVILGTDTEILAGKETIRDVLCGVSLDMSPESFFQVNHGMAGLLYGRAAELLDLKAGERLLDLFCGIGSIGLCAAAKTPGIFLTGVEISGAAAANAAANARLNGIDAEFICGDANMIGDIGADAMVIDPPRKGVGAELIDLLCEKGPEKIVYISCNPETLARDLAGLGKAYSWERAETFDLFPRTGHTESAARLFRR
ncbi:MAG: 23S rRNA (uracil(1939)-C(5))-methyltransferase RlmD [Clostridiales bacterium]|nr:23S rRNA (uracil(1939)-C(5))-methyltransferase RlmD [Clostridiales bacterium]